MKTYIKEIKKLQTEYKKLYNEYNPKELTEKSKSLIPPDPNDDIDKLDNRYNKLSDKMKNLNTEIKLYYIKEINKFKQEYENLYREKHKKPIPESLYFIKTISDENNDITTLDKRFERLKTEILLLNPKYIFSE